MSRALIRLLQRLHLYGAGARLATDSFADVYAVTRDHRLVRAAVAR